MSDGSGQPGKNEGERGGLVGRDRCLSPSSPVLNHPAVIAFGNRRYHEGRTDGALSEKVRTRRKKRSTHEPGWRDSPEAWGEVVAQAMKDLEGGAVETSSLVVFNGAYHVISVQPGTIQDVKPCRHSP